MKIEIHPRAADDIIRQFRYYLVDQGAPAVAFRFREAVIESVEQLKPHPRMGTLFSRFAFRSSFMATWEASGRLRVVRILHGKRNVRRILKREKS